MRKVDADDAEILSGIIANNSLDGVYTHGINRFPRIVSNLESGVIDASVEVTLTSAAGSMECWDGHYGIGAINAFKCMRRAIELASQYGIMSIPTLIFIKNGKLEKTLVGLRDKQELVSIIQEL